MKTPIILLALLLAGCGWTGGEAVQAAQKACEPYGGIKFLLGRASASDYKVVCDNDVIIEGTVK